VSARALALALLFGAAFPALAQYTGSFRHANPRGETIILTLRQDAQNRVTGTLSGRGTGYKVQATVNQKGLVGTLTGEQTLLYIAADLRGRELHVILAETDRDTKPNLGVTQQFVFTRAPPANDPASARAYDEELRRILTRNPWCAETVDRATGAGRTDRVVFEPDGRLLQPRDLEGKWRILGGTLQLSADGKNWRSQSLQVAQTAAGLPTINSGGLDYIVCK
jgi:hypothetical protein